MAKTSTNKVSIQPLSDRVVVKATPKDEISASGIIIPDSAKQDAPSRGEVVATGPGKYEDGQVIPMTIKVGDTILFSKYGYDEIKIDGQEYYILSESSVLGIIKSHD